MFYHALGTRESNEELAKINIFMSVMISDDFFHGGLIMEEIIARKYRVLSGLLNKRQRRLWAAVTA